MWSPTAHRIHLLSILGAGCAKTARLSIGHGVSKRRMNANSLLLARSPNQELRVVAMDQDRALNRDCMDHAVVVG
jgi:hypothetical protein